MTLIPLAPALWVLNAPMNVFGMQLGHRMTVARLSDTTLWLHSPVAYAPALGAELAAIGRVTHVVAPNAMHDTYLEAWVSALPEARFHAAPGLAGSRPDLRFTDTLGESADAAWAGVFDQLMLQGMPRVNEVVFFHRASRTLIITDLAFNLGDDMPFLSRMLTRFNGCYCRFGPSRLLQSTIKDRAALKRSIHRMLEWDFDRIVLSHGDNVPTGGRELLRDSFAFL